MPDAHLEKRRGKKLQAPSRRGQKEKRKGQGREKLRGSPSAFIPANKPPARPHEAEEGKKAIKMWSESKRIVTGPSLKKKKREKKSLRIASQTIFFFSPS